MEGADKPLLEWRGQPLVDWVIAQVPQDMPLLISANRNVDEYRRRATVVTDQGLPGEGPLVGILAGLSLAKTEYVAVIPGDAPKLPPQWLQRLEQAMASNRALAAVVTCDEERQQNLHLLLRKSSCVESLETFLRTGRHQVFRWLDSLNTTAVKFTGSVSNFNQQVDFNQ